MKTIEGAFLATAVLVLATSCATGYHDSSLTGGFDETQLGPNTYQIRFSGNAYTSNDRASEFLMRRAAEVTLMRGYCYFKLLSAESFSETSMGYRFPSREAIIQLQSGPTEESLTATLIVEQTNEQAEGSISIEARKQMKNCPSPKEGGPK